MRTPKNNDSGFVQEEIAVDEWIPAVIEDVEYEEEHEFKGKFARKQEAVRFKFKLEGYEHSKYSRWMTFSYSEKSNLYKKYIVPLVPTATPYFEFDIDSLKGHKCKLMYSKEKGEDGKEYYNIELVKPRTQCLQPKSQKSEIAEEIPEIQLDDEEAPF